MTTKSKQKLNNDLLKSAKNGNLDGVKRALSGGAYINVIDDIEGSTPLMLAASNGKKDVVIHLLNNNADTSIKTNSLEENCLDLAIGEHNDIADLLIDRGMSVNDGRHIVDFAAYGHTECVEFLLDHGVDVNAFYLGDTPIMVAKDVETARLLLDRGADLSLKSDRGHTVFDRLTIQIESGDIEDDVLDFVKSYVDQKNLDEQINNATIAIQEINF